ncbi:suppressor of cytokine signaling 2-like [Asterias rubens]|uniref:suppressor of cytokine signaling 2-like n=1 Tax=Asterias rubens TaxID=7604 RepID=UPI001455B13E|nr:suppressor of cytokine signaling 2-like [Asterias rubens]
MCVELLTAPGIVGKDVPCTDRESAVWAPMPPGCKMTHYGALVSDETTRKQRTTDDDFERLTCALEMLNISGWYHGAMTFTEAKRKLRSSDIGTFLVRDSSDPNYLFTLSVKTPKGTTSVRIEYEFGKFTLDSEEALRRLAPKFDCVVKLLYYYIQMSRLDDSENDDKNKRDKSKRIENGRTTTSKNPGQLVWLEPSGRRELMVKIIKPLRSEPPSLQHLCRVALNSSVETRQQTEFLPGKLKSYLRQYPFDQ